MAVVAVAVVLVLPDNALLWVNLSNPDLNPNPNLKPDPKPDLLT